MYLIDDFYEDLGAELQAISLEDPQPTLTKPANLNHNLKISLHAMTSTVNPKTMKVVARVGTCLLVVLIDLGSTHNFLHLNVMQKIHVHYDSKETVKVRVASGAVVSSEGKVYQVPLSIQGWEFEVEAYVINLAGCDMVLEVAW